MFIIKISDGISSFFVNVFSKRFVADAWLKLPGFKLLACYDGTAFGWIRHTDCYFDSLDSFLKR